MGSLEDSNLQTIDFKASEQSQKTYTHSVGFLTEHWLR